MSPRDEQPELTREEASFPEDCLLESLQAFLDTGNASRLGMTKGLAGDDTVRLAAAVLARRSAALERRMRLVHTSVLFAAIAVEAAANLYIAIMAPQVADELDDLKTVNKLLVAPSIAGGEALFTVGEEPHGGVVRLFKLRNRVVHPKIGRQAAVGSGGDDYTPRAAGEGLIAAARTVAVLSSACGLYDELVIPVAPQILRWKKDLLKSSRDWTADLPKAPSDLDSMLETWRKTYGLRAASQSRPRARLRKAAPQPPSPS